MSRALPCLCSGLGKLILLETFQEVFAVTSWDMGYFNPEQGSMLSSEGLAWVSDVKFAHMLEEGHELLQVFPCQISY